MSNYVGGAKPGREPAAPLNILTHPSVWVSPPRPDVGRPDADTDPEDPVAFMVEAKERMESSETLAIWFCVEGDVRYLSHRDTMRLWQRALVRAGAPLRFSQGFNPHPRLSLPLPRSVGMSAAAELLVVELENREAGEAVWPSVGSRARLQNELPGGLRILSMDRAPRGVRWRPDWACYRIESGPEVDRAALRARIERFHEAAEIRVDRAARGRHPRRTVSLREGVSELALREGMLACTIKLGGEVTVRIDELLGWLGLSGPGAVASVQRIKVGYSAGGGPPGRSGVSAKEMEPPPEENEQTSI